MSSFPMRLAFCLSLAHSTVWAGDPEDDDGDGQGESAGDCDDTDASVFSGAEEICDDKDNDCDGEIDEGTDCADDDGDGFTESEGDCDDQDQSIHPLASESVNGEDDDCDGLIDEDTEVFDDDGDGWSEEEGDCDDADPDRSPGETDWCRDGIDNDCDGYVDDPCEEDNEDGCDADLTVALSTSAFSGRPGAEVMATAVPNTVDRALDPVVSWYVTHGEVEELGPEARWTLPDVEGTYEIHVYLTDACGFQAMDARDVEVRPEEVQIAEVEVTAGGCGGGQAWLIFLVPGLLGGRRRLTFVDRKR